MTKKPKQKNYGFTLIEVMVSVSIFSIVMLISTGAVFSIVEANKKSHTLKSVMTNLNFALESMARDMRVGDRFTCSAWGSGPFDCQNGGATFSYKANRSIDSNPAYDPADQNDAVEYTLAENRIRKKVYNSGSPEDFYITAKEIVIEDLTFYVLGTGSVPADLRQPKVVITIKGYAGTGNTKSQFNIQTTVSQRSIDS
ncbi:MAG: type II secretion system protein [Patescibacteria group bacterium]